jgi:hypothetical protein
MEAYARALAGIGVDARVRRSLELVLAQHARAAALARDRSAVDVDDGGDDARRRAACPSWADVVGGALRPTLEALRARETHWTRAYVALRDDPVLTAHTHALLQSTLLPQQRGHVAVLDRLLESI